MGREKIADFINVPARSSVAAPTKADVGLLQFLFILSRVRFLYGDAHTLCPPQCNVPC